MDKILILIIVQNVAVDFEFSLHCVIGLLSWEKRVMEMEGGCWTGKTNFLVVLVGLNLYVTLLLGLWERLR